MTLISRGSSFSALIIGLLPALSLPGQEVASPESVGMSAERLERITAEAENQVNEGNLVGMVSLVARHGKIVYLRAAGHQNREEGVPMRTDSIFRIASFTKPVTSLAVLMLYEDGKIQLTDPVSKYIPAFKDMKVIAANGTLEDARREITIHDLLTHNAGLAYHSHEIVGSRYLRARIACGLYADEDPIGDDVVRLAGIPLAQQPGSGFLYGLNTDVLGHLVEVVSGRSLAEFFEERLFVPLGMVDTKFFLAEADVPRLAQLYVRDEQGRLVAETSEERIVGGYPLGSRNPFEGPRISYSGGGGLCSTAEDYFRFCQMVLQKGEYRDRRLLSRMTIEQATRPHLPIPRDFFCGDSSDFGLGFAVQKSSGVPRPGSPGTLRWGSVFNGFFFIDPQEEIVGITISQMFLDSDEWSEKFMQLVYAAVDD
ncbi:MAG: serine hydrolase domain-containing protein [Planctomycetota bacterium]|jgi:CubicO group peptidase (beta-lactamase class C family)